MATTLQQKIDDARAAYHELLVGRSPRVIVDQNGERVEYTQANRAALLQYIQSLERQRDGACAKPLGPAKVWFG